MKWTYVIDELIKPFSWNMGRTKFVQMIEFLLFCQYWLESKLKLKKEVNYCQILYTNLGKGQKPKSKVVYPGLSKSWIANFRQIQIVNWCVKYLANCS